MSYSPFEQSAETRALIAFLRKVKIGETATYVELSAVAGQPVVGASGPLQTARYRLLIDDDAVFAAVRNIGVMRLDDRGIINEAVSRSEYVRRYSKRTVLRATKITDFSALPRDYQQRHSATVAINATVAFMTTPKQMEKLEAAVEGKRELPISDTLRMFTTK